MVTRLYVFCSLSPPDILGWWVGVGWDGGILFPCCEETLNKTLIWLIYPRVSLVLTKLCVFCPLSFPDIPQCWRRSVALGLFRWRIARGPTFWPSRWPPWTPWGRSARSAIYRPRSVAVMPHRTRLPCTDWWWQLYWPVVKDGLYWPVVKGLVLIDGERTTVLILPKMKKGLYWPIIKIKNPTHTVVTVDERGL